MNKDLLKKIVAFLSIAFVAAFLFFVYINFDVRKEGEGKIYDIKNAPEKQVALVLGARVHENGRLSDMFRDRVDTAIDLYESGKVQKILVSGDHGTEEYDEVNAAKDYLISRGVEGKDIFLDHAGFDTYDSVYRAREIFQVESMIIVTQEYHLPRALYIADKLEVDSAGVRADLHTYGGQEGRDFREKFAVVKAWIDVTFGSEPRFLGESIPISGDGFASWD